MLDYLETNSSTDVRRTLSRKVQSLYRKHKKQFNIDSHNRHTIVLMVVDQVTDAHEQLVLCTNLQKNNTSLIVAISSFNFIKASTSHNTLSPKPFSVRNNTDEFKRPHNLCSTGCLAFRLKRVMAWQHLPFNTSLSNIIVSLNVMQL